MRVIMPRPRWMSQRAKKTLDAYGTHNGDEAD
jgi:hypothetical protein